MKNVQKLLFQAKQELNFLYTEPPSWRNGGMDEGWFCREHAYHVYVLSLIVGIPASIVVGHYAACLGDGKIRTSFGTDCDHAWNEVDLLLPVDLSMTFRFSSELNQSNIREMVEPITCTGEYGPFRVSYFTQYQVFETMLNSARLDSCWIAFLEQTRPNLQISNTEIPLYVGFFLPTDIGGWANVFGDAIFNKVSLHIYKVAVGHVEGIAGKMPPQEAIRRIAKGYSGATGKLIKLLGRKN